MTEKEWRVPLDGASYLAVQVVRQYGRIVGFSVVLIKDGECITRYDCAHEMPHRDILGKQNAFIRKEFCKNLSKEEAFEYAIADLKTNAEKYIAYWQTH